MSKLTLYSGNPSRCLTNQWLLAELGLPCQLKLLDLEANEHKSAEYLEINPMGKVPTLQHEDVIVTESAAIALYLAEQLPDKGLSVPVDSPLRGDYLRWCLFSPIKIEPSIVSKAFGLSHPDYKPFTDIETVAETLRLAIGKRP
ncbi:MAG: glutathione S-transferase [Patiriisocius sp.]|jgi:glutathione S-transferase